MSRLAGRPPTALVVDSGACLPPALGESPWVSVVPMSIELDGRVLRDGLDITSQELYRRLAGPGPLPSSSSPSPGDYLKVFRAIPSSDIVCLTIPEQYSMMGRSARVAAEMLRSEDPEKHIEILNTGTAAGGYTLVAEAAAAACAAGLEREKVAAHVREVAASARVIAALDTLRYLVRSGRVPALAGLSGDLLHVRPVFAFAGGDVRRLGLVRGTRRALRAVAEHLREQTPPETEVRLAVFCGDSPDAVPELSRHLRELFGERPVERLNLTPVIALHTGPGLIGAAAVADIPLEG
ncbi:MAG TPA: DegV family protein [Candidatus Acidoferrales bacterium]|nr:DegV family protein [Candidatus Acidoferrales bacterium]